LPPKSRGGGEAVPLKLSRGKKWAQKKGRDEFKLCVSNFDAQTAKDQSQKSTGGRRDLLKSPERSRNTYGWDRNAEGVARPKKKKKGNWEADWVST